MRVRENERVRVREKERDRESVCERERSPFMRSSKGTTISFAAACENKCGSVVTPIRASA